jgi:hypothetical protein
VVVEDEVEEAEVEVAEVEVAKVEARVTVVDQNHLVVIDQKVEAQQKVLQQRIGRKQPHLEQVLMLATRYLAWYEI